MRKAKNGTASAPETMALAKIEEVNGPAALLHAAVQAGANVETLERLVALHERVEERRAEEEFLGARARFQAACPSISKSSNADYSTKAGGRVRYSYAALDEIARTIRPILHREGLSYSWDSSVAGGNVKAVCILRHVGGGAASASFEAPFDERMTGPQKVASTLTYARRQALVQVLGLTTTDEDDDVRPDEDEDDGTPEAALTRPAPKPAPAPKIVRPNAAAPADPAAPLCAVCGEPMTDFREEKAAGAKPEKFPDWKCEDRSHDWKPGTFQYGDGEKQRGPSRKFPGKGTPTMAELAGRGKAVNDIANLARELGLATAGTGADGHSALTTLLDRRFQVDAISRLPDVVVERLAAGLKAYRDERAEPIFDGGLLVGLRAKANGVDLLADPGEEGEEIGF